MVVARKMQCMYCLLLRQSLPRRKFLLTVSTRRSIPLLAGITFSRPCCLVPDRARALSGRRFCCDLTVAGLLAQPIEMNERQQRLRWWLFQAVAAKQKSDGREKLVAAIS